VTPNPFSTRFIRPGAIPFIFLGGESAEALVDRFRDHNWWGQIIGPHGSGKSTLVATLAPLLEAAGRQVMSITIRQGEHRLSPFDRDAFASTTQLVIDGYEQLSWWSRRRVKSLCRRRGAGLLVTAHADVGFPTLYQMQPNEELACAVVTRLLDGDSHIDREDVGRSYAAASGNLRETLFKLYDLYQGKTASKH
jgi:energy-coupling factor transporter ATP-binding protein EcfA2